MTGFWWLTWCIKQFFSPSKCHKDQSEYIVEGEESLSNKNLQRNHQAGRKIFTHLAKIVFTDQQDYLIFNFVLPEPHNLLSTDFFAIGNDSGKILHAFENAGPAESWKPLVWKKYGLHQVYKSLFHCESYVVKKEWEVFKTASHVALKTAGPIKLYLTVISASRSYYTSTESLKH